MLSSMRSRSISLVLPDHAVPLGQADRCQPSHHVGGAWHGWVAVASRPDADGEAVDAISASSQNVSCWPARPASLQIKDAGPVLLPRPVRVPDHVREAPQPESDKAELHIAQQAEPGFEQQLLEWFFIVLRRLVGGSPACRVGRRWVEQVELSWSAVHAFSLAEPVASQGLKVAIRRPVAEERL